MFQTFSIPSQQYYELLVLPQFADLVPPGVPYSMNEFTIMDNVPSSRPIVDIKGVQNIMQRRDASCDINYKKVLGATIRKISTEEIYGATQFCRNEFYQGCLKDWRNNDPVFANKILPFFLKAINADIASNAWFGDVERVAPVTNVWSTDIFDGVFKWIKRYIAANVIPASQTITIADGTDYTATPASAYNLLKSMYEKQSLLMYALPDSQKVFTVSKEIARGYEDYLISIGIQATGYTLVTNGINRLAYKGIPVIEKELWTPIITELKGSPGYAAMLTIKGNFVFATDSNYGEGPDGKTAMEVWYETKDMTWYYRFFMKAGTQVALPEHTIVALSAWT